jgi:LysM repeat protein
MPKDPHITGGIRHDWAAIKHEYVTDPNTSLRKIAKKYGVSLNTIAKKSKAEDWFATRKKTQTQIVTKGITKTVNKMADELSKESDFLERMKGHMDRMLQDDMQYQRHLVETKTFGEDGGMTIATEERLYNKYDSKAMKDSMQILQMMESMTRSLYNIQKAEALERQQIERERLELEKERLALERERNALRNGNTGSEDNMRYGVVLIPEVIDNE